jgi:hypothetical protein
MYDCRWIVPPLRPNTCEGVRVEPNSAEYAGRTWGLAVSVRIDKTVGVPLNGCTVKSKRPDLSRNQPLSNCGTLPGTERRCAPLVDLPIDVITDAQSRVHLS